jgi:adenylate cyclase class 2
MVEPLTFEDNVVFDDSVGSLRGSGRLLRLRRYGDRWTLTFKGPAQFAGGVKTRAELESVVADGGTVTAILAALGWIAVRRYQKRREVWRLAGTAVVLDETPMGCFIEIEGEAGALPALARSLGLDPERAARGSYVELWAAYRAEHPELPADMVFP